MVEKCVFCGYEIERGTGKFLVQKDGTIVHFCSNKCEKNLRKLKRNPIKTKWTYAYRKFAGKVTAKEKAEEVKALREEAEEAKKEGAKPKTPKFKDEGEKKEEKPAEEKKEEKAEEKKQ